MNKYIFSLFLISIILFLDGCNRNVNDDIVNDDSSEPKIEQEVLVICKDKIVNKEDLIQIATINGTQAELGQKCVDKCKELYNLTGVQYNPLQKFGFEEFKCICEGSSIPCK